MPGNRRTQYPITCDGADGEQTLFIVLQYDQSRIYKNEYNMILRIVQEIKLEARQREIPLSFIEMDVSAAS